MKKIKSKYILFIGIIVFFVFMLNGLYTAGGYFLIALFIFGLIAYLLKGPERHREAQKKKAAPYLNRLAQIIEESQNIIMNTKNLNTAVKRYETIFKKLDEIKSIYDLYPGSQPSDFDPDNTKERLKDERDQYVVSFLINQADDLISKAESLKGIKSKFNQINKVVLKLSEGKQYIDSEEEVEKIEFKEKELQLLVHRMELEEYLEKAKKAEFIGQKSKAIIAYKEALYFLENDDIEDSLQQEELKQIEAKIEELAN